ncbi:uncharacterized protein LOC117592233 isoform X1 [Drosophila guanche]|uniref:uncharacterized protein LOC117592233 isoform X1 n=1 Tax=Drosophila guanche TaxID=7266 RepID=UPI00147167E4|nr:uncharacterized protein LOC117592233 isoform X1 [Drosophila guanche]
MAAYKLGFQACRQTVLASMQCLRFAVVLSFFLLLSHAQTYNLKQIGVCIQILLQATSDLSRGATPIARTMFECVGFKTSQNVTSLDGRTFKEVASKFVVELVQSPSCLLDVAEAVKKLLGPHFARLKTYRCMYLGVASSCMPKDL